MTKEFNQFRWESSISERLKNNLKSVEYVQNNEEVKLQQDEYMSLDMFVKSTKMIQGIRDRIK